MKYFNSVTGQYEDDGQEVIQPQMINIPAGRAVASQGSQDVNIPVYADLLKQRQQNTMDLNMDMQTNPEAYPFSKMIDLSKPYGNIPLPLKQQQVPQRAPTSEMNPMVKAYLLNKMKPVKSEDAAPQVDQMLDIPQEKSNVLDQFSPEKYQQALAQMKDKQSNLGLAQFAAGMGDALARKDSSATDRYFQDARNNIQDQTVGEFNRQKAGAINDVKTKQQLSQLDPNSQESQNFRKLVQSTMPNIAKAYGDKFNMLTAADKDSILDFGRMREQIDARREQMQIHRDMKTQELNRKNLPEERLKNMNGTDKARFDNALMVLKGIDEMGGALDNGQNTFSVVGDNDYSAASRRATEAYGRMQSGGAINKDEEKRFEKTLPSVSDSKDIQRKKLLTQREEMLSRLKTLGFKPEDIGYQPKDFNYGKGKSSQSQPKTIKQNGHTFTLNPETGEYE